MQAEAKGSITLQQAHSIQRELTAVLVTTQINAMLEQAIPEAFRHNR